MPRCRAGALEVLEQSQKFGKVVVKLELKPRRKERWIVESTRARASATQVLTFPG